MTSRWFYFLCSIEGAVALVALLLIPSEGGNLSPARLALLAIIISLMLIFTWMGFRPPTPTRLAQPLPVVISALLSLTFSLLLFLLRYLDPEQLLPLYQRLSPLLWYLLVLSLQFTFFLLALKNGLHIDALRRNKPIYLSSLSAFCLLLLVLLFVSLTKLGITKDEAYWGEPGVAIPGWQFALAILLGLGVLMYAVRNTHYANSPLVQYLLPFSIYLIASALWLSVPISSLKNSFYAPITPPYTTPFPYSDAGFYDYLAQSLLIGTDYLGGIPPRPMYVTFLAALHFLFGQDYVKIIAAQTVVFALFPVALYLLGTKLHSRAAGVTIAFFAIFRELTTLWVSSNTRAASTKMFVTDFATSLGIALVCLLVMRWLERRDIKSALIAGGAFGLLLLLRTQSLVILPFVFILAWFAYQKKWKDWLLACVAFGLVMSATIAPWLTRNYLLVGQFAFDDPSQMAVIFSQYSFDENLDISQFDFENESLGNRIVTFTLQNPGFVAGFVANHFLNTEIGGLLALPLIQPFNGLREPTNLYWIEWNGTLEGYNLALVLVYLAVIAIGFGAAWKRLGWIGFTPLAFNVGYALANGISRFSSWRYNLPVDWVIYFYFGIGAIEILVWAFSIFGANISTMPENRNSELNKTLLKPATIFFIVAAFMFAGATPWLAQGFAQPRYTSTDEVLKDSVVAQDSAILEFLSQPDAQIVEGRLLYPRFFRRNDGIFSAHPWPIYAVRDFSRLGFIVLSERAVSVVFPANSPLPLPHGDDVIVLGCQRSDYLEARWIFLPDSDETYPAEALNESCNP
jgi:hypothetical protein